jgi:membrane associated rhomboid family serine protease
MQSLLDHPVSVTLALIAVNVAVSLCGFAALRSDRWRSLFLFVPFRFAQGKNWAGMLLSHFSHGDVGHLLLNMLALFFFGPSVETELGSGPYLLLYAISGLAGTLTVFVLRRKNPRYAALGASGCIAGVVFAMVVLAPTSRIFLYVVPLPAPVFALLYLVISSVNMGGRDGVAHEAHLGGAVAGFVAAGLLYERGFGPFVQAAKDLVS